MNHKQILVIGVFMILLSMSGIVISFFIASIIGVIISIILLVVSILGMFLGISLDMFIRDKILDIEQLSKQGYTPIECNNCGKQNILEDKFCIYCGEKLDGQLK